MNENLEKAIEAILFWKGEPLTIAELMRALRVPSGEVTQALRTLKEKLAGRGVTLVRTDNEVSLATASPVSELIARLQKEELSHELGKAALETLSIILYRAPVTRRDIEYIRGVNSTAILRSLLIRGLIERTQSERDERLFLYQPSIALLAHLGIHSREELPEYAPVRAELDTAMTEPTSAMSEENQTLLE